MFDPISLKAASAILPGRELPGAELTNERLSSLMADVAGRYAEHGIEVAVSDPSFPADRVGIQSRRVLDASLSARDLALAAGSAAVVRAGVDPADIKCVVVASVTPDRVVPALATTVHEGLGLPISTPAFDLTLGCNGFVAGLDVATRYLQGEPEGAAALVIGADTMTRILDASDRATCPIFGDGGGACVLQRTPDPGMTPVRMITMGASGDRIQIRADRAQGTEPMMRFVAEGDSMSVRVDPLSRARVVMDGRQVFRDMLRLVPEAIAGYLDEHRTTVADLDGVVLHQANLRMIEAIVCGRTLNIPRDLLLSNIESVGNTTNASIPILLSEAQQDGRLRSGDRIAVVGFGTGYSIGLTLVTLP